MNLRSLKRIHEGRRNNKQQYKKSTSRKKKTKVIRFSFKSTSVILFFLAQPSTLSVRLLEPAAGRTSSVLLGLAPAGVGNEKAPVISNQKIPDLLLAGLIDEFLVVGNDGLGNGLPDGVDLGSNTSPLDTDSDVQVSKFILTKDEDGLESLQAKNLGLEQFNGAPVDLDEATACLAESDGSGGLLSAKDLDTVHGSHVVILGYCW